MSKRNKVVSGILRTNQKPSKPATTQQASEPAKTSERKKATFQLDPHDIELLEKERHQRRMAGIGANLSELVREAIRKAYGKPPSSFEASAEAFESGRARAKARR